jgi:hypothetical protein
MHFSASLIRYPLQSNFIGEANCCLPCEAFCLLTNGWYMNLLYHSISWHIHFGTVEIANRQMATIFQSIFSVVKIYKKQGFKVTHIFLDEEFEPLRGDLASLEIQLTWCQMLNMFLKWNNTFVQWKIEPDVYITPSPSNTCHLALSLKWFKQVIFGLMPSHTLIVSLKPLVQEPLWLDQLLITIYIVLLVLEPMYKPMRLMITQWLLGQQGHWHFDQPEMPKEDFAFIPYNWSCHYPELLDRTPYAKWSNWLCGTSSTKSQYCFRWSCI